MFKTVPQAENSGDDSFQVVDDLVWKRETRIVKPKADGSNPFLIAIIFLAACWTLTPAAWAQAAPPCGILAYPPLPPKETVVFPLEQVRRGLCGVAYTVFEGVDPEPMQVEILGLLQNARGPGRDMILARLHGPRVEFTGVVAGMSGSPVYVEGRLVGALSFRIGQFSKEPIAGITPIEQMLAVRAGESPAGISKAGDGGKEAQATAIETPLIFGGFSQETIDRFGDRFRALGLSPVAGLGGGGSATRQPQPIIPGSAVSAILVRGDLSMSGACTVTYVDATRLLACGHPITQFGQVDMPMTKATVLATLPSPLNAFKIINTTETVGAFTEDRNSAIMGSFGRKARMIPVSVAVARAGTPGETFHFEVVNNKDLTPQIMLVSIYQSLQQTDLASAETSYRLSGELAVQGEPPVRLEAMIPPGEGVSATINTALWIGEKFSRIYSNSAEQPIITGMRLKLDASPQSRMATIEQARLSRSEVRPGDTIEIEVTLHVFRQPATIVRIPVAIPPSTAPGELRLVLSDAATADKMVLPGTTPGPAHEVSLRDTIDQINRAHGNNRLYVMLLEHSVQTLLEGGTLGKVPLSVANVLEPLRTEQKMQLTGETAVELGSVDTGYSVTGMQVFTLHVR